METAISDVLKQIELHMEFANDTFAFEEGSVDALRRFERNQIVDRSNLDF